MSNAGGTLKGARILVVEDEMMAASMAELVLGDCGAVVVGPAASVEQGLALLEGASIDAAVLDINLGGNPVFPVADALAARGVPFVFVTGYGTEGAHGRQYPGTPVVQKPYDDAALVATIARQLAARQP